MDPCTIIVSDTESNNLNNRLHNILQSILDLNNEAEAILNSIEPEQSGSEDEVEYLGGIRIESKSSTIPKHSYRSQEIGVNIECVFGSQVT